MNRTPRPPAPAGGPPRSSCAWRRTAAAVLLAAAPPLALAADAESAGALADLSIEQLLDAPVQTVFGASKFEQKVTQAPASISIITSDEIRRFGYRSLADVLRAVRGMYVTQDRNYASLGVRGFARPGDWNTRVLLMVDGHRMNDGIYNSAMPEALIDLDLVDRIEVIRGPGSSIYGSNAFFGVINLITRKGGQLDGAEVAGGLGSLGSYQGRIGYGRSLANGLEMVLSGSTTGSAGHARLYYPEFDAPETNHGVAENSDGESARRLHGTASFGGLTLSGAYARRDKDVPTASFGSFFGVGRQRTRDERMFVEGAYRHDFGATLALDSRVSLDRYAFFGSFPFNYAAPGEAPVVVVTYGDTHAQSAAADMQLTSRPTDDLVLVAGGEYRRNLRLFQSDYTENPRTYGGYDDRDGTSYAAFAQAEYRFTERTLANLGLRYDRFDSFGRLSPRVALIHAPWELTNIKLLYGEAFRAPNAYEQFLDSPGYMMDNPALQPERIRTYEAIVEQALPSGLRLSLSGYQYHVVSLISQEFDGGLGVLQFRNAGEVSAHGAELELEDQVGAGIWLRGSYAWQRATDAAGDELDNAPRHLAKLNATAPVGLGLIGALELQYTSGLETLTGASTGGFTVANLTLSAPHLWRSLEASASAYNLFDRDYAYPGAPVHVQDQIPQDGRTLFVKLTYRF